MIGIFARTRDNSELGPGRGAVTTQVTRRRGIPARGAVTTSRPGKDLSAFPVCGSFRPLASQRVQR
jgi:hypothetical protein